MDAYKSSLEKDTKGLTATYQGTLPRVNSEKWNVKERKLKRPIGLTPFSLTPEQNMRIANACM